MLSVVNEAPVLIYEDDCPEPNSLTVISVCDDEDRDDTAVADVDDVMEAPISSDKGANISLPALLKSSSRKQ